MLDELDWPGKDEGLSERESQVLALVAEGLTNAEIGARLYLGAETVKTYLRQACSKLGFRNRVQAATYVARSQSFARHHPEDALSPLSRPGPLQADMAPRSSPIARASQRDTCIWFVPYRSAIAACDRRRQ